MDRGPDCGVGTLPAGADRGAGILGVGAVAGIGFTVSIFVAGLAFDDQPLLENDAKIGILAASIIAAAVGSLVLARRQKDPPTARGEE